MVPPIFKFLFIVLFYRASFPLYYSVASNAWHRAKPIPLCRAVPWCRRCIKQNLSLRREQAPALRYDSIITQIGRENKFSAEILLLRTVEDACPYKCCVKLPYEKLRYATRFFIFPYSTIDLISGNSSARSSSSSLKLSLCKRMSMVTRTSPFSSFSISTPLIRIFISVNLSRILGITV